MNKPKIIAHRGTCKGLPTNSEAGLKHAIDNNADGLEVDVQLTKDNIPVLFHDSTSFKLTGRKKRIFSYTFHELLQFDIENEKIPTLKKTIQKFSKKTYLYIEIKSDKFERASRRSELLTQKVVAQVLNIEHEYQNNIFILSFDPDILKQAFSISDKIKCVLNVNDYSKKDKWRIPAKDILKKKFLCNHLAGLCINENKLTSELVNFAHENKMEMLTYSCNTEKQLNRLSSIDLDGIMTDRAEWLTKRIQHETGN